MKRHSGALCLAGAFMLAGTSVIAARYVSGKLGAFSITAVSLLFALPALLAACGKKLPAYTRQMGRADWALALLQAVFGVFLFRMFLLYGLLRTSSAEAGMLTGATPAATALLAGIALREPVGRLRAAGIACTAGGIALLQGLRVPPGGFSASHLAGNLLVLLAALSESVFNILSRAGFARAGGSSGRQRNPICQAALVTAAALLLCLVPALLENPRPGSPRSMRPAGWRSHGTAFSPRRWPISAGIPAYAGKRPQRRPPIPA